MMRQTALTTAVLLAALAAASPAPAKAHHASTCARARAAMASGKSAKEVAKELNVSSATVTRCERPGQTGKATTKQ